MPFTSDSIARARVEVEKREGDERQRDDGDFQDEHGRIVPAGRPRREPPNGRSDRMDAKAVV